MDTASIRTTPEVVPNARAERDLSLYRERGDQIQTLGEDVFGVPSCTDRKVYPLRYARRSGVKGISTLAVAAGDPFKAASKMTSCAGCGDRFSRRDMIEVGDEDLVFGHEVLEGERYCRPCARRRGVL